MRRVGASVVAFLLVSSGMFGVASAGGAAGESGAYIVVLEEWVGSPRAVAAEHARVHGAEITHVYEYALKGYAATMGAEAAARVAADERVAYVSADRPVTLDAQTVPTGVNRVDAELSTTAGIDGVDVRVDVDVAVIDTGVDLDHPDLNVNVAAAKNCSSGRSAEDLHGHGTHVAGTVGALDNGFGVVGVAPGARIWPVRVLNAAGFGSFASVICGVDYVTAHASEIEVANMSLGGTGSEPAGPGCSTGDALHDAICNSVAAGVTYAVAAGNSADDAANHVPAAYDEVITVSALADFDGLPGGLAAATCRADEDDTLANFSNFGADIDLIGPGVCILSTYKQGGYATFSGTSMSTPHVAGGAALYLATHPSATPTRVKGALQRVGTVDWNNVDDPDGTKEGLLNVATF